MPECPDLENEGPSLLPEGSAAGPPPRAVGVSNWSGVFPGLGSRWGSPAGVSCPVGGPWEHCVMLDMVEMEKIVIAQRSSHPHVLVEG